MLLNYYLGHSLRWGGYSFSSMSVSGRTGKTVLMKSGNWQTLTKKDSIKFWKWCETYMLYTLMIEDQMLN